MATLNQHPGKWLNDQSAASFNRMQDVFGRKFNVTSAGRSVAEQNGYIHRYYVVGGKNNRPPFLYPPARPAESSPHVRNGGEAIDIGDASHRQWIKEHPEFGWYFNIPSDVVHAVYDPNRDEVRKRLEQPAPAPSPAPDQGGWRDFGGAVPASEGSNPLGIAWAAGLQKIARRYGYTGRIDQIMPQGSRSWAGFVQFLRKNWGYSGNDVLGPNMWAAIARWLRANYGYRGDDRPGPAMRGALARAEAANYKAL